ncbi:hypothetical protein C8J57DRAFT_1500537 [Mycena rebaudengoi]|nr:hypothetical protein C8J57DRAFT_1500537 [Mycena rebaudengoi]
MVSHIMVLSFSHLAFPWFSFQPGDTGWRPPTGYQARRQSPAGERNPLKTFGDRVTSLGILVISARSSRGRHHSHHDPEERTIYPLFPVRSARSGRVPTRTDHPGVRAKPAFEDLGRASVLVTEPGVVPATDPSSSSGDVAVIPGAHLRLPL